MVADAGGQVISELRYSAFGEIRYQNGTLTTDYLYTGQRQEAEIGLYYYVARWYDPAIGRFIQADSVVPNPMSAKGFDRYSYSYNSPLNFLDPSGHRPILLDGEQFAETDQSLGITNHISSSSSTYYYSFEEPPDKEIAFPDKNYDHSSQDNDTWLGQCEDGYGTDACQYWNSVFDPWAFFSEDEKQIFFDSVHIFGGWENMLSEANECFRSLTPGECNNPFWAQGMGNDDLVKGYYEGMFGSASASNINPLMRFLLDEVNADPYEPANWDPLWLAALSTNQQIFYTAKDKAFIYFESDGYMSDYGDEFLDRVLKAKTEGLGD